MSKFTTFPLGVIAALSPPLVILLTTQQKCQSLQRFLGVIAALSPPLVILLTTQRKCQNLRRFLGVIAALSPTVGDIIDDTTKMSKFYNVSLVLLQLCHHRW